MTTLFSQSTIGRHPWVVVAIASASLAAWMGLGTLHDFQHADSLLPVLISTQRWTPFFWAEDRFGMLVPLLAMPIHDPLANLLAQGWMMTSAALLAPFVVARFLTARSSEWIGIGACTNLLFLLITRPVVHFDWFVNQPYGLSIFLGFAALVVADRHARNGGAIAAIALLALACWINISIVVMLVIAAVAKGSRSARLLTLEGAGAALAFLLSRYCAAVHTVVSMIPPRQWAESWKKLFENAASTIASPADAVAVAVGVAFSVGWLWRTGGLPHWKRAAAILAMVVGTWLFVGTLLWVEVNRYSARYMYPTLMMVGVGVSIVFAALFAKRAKELSITTLAMLLVVVIVGYGTPSLGRIERRLNDRFGVQTAAVLRSGATVIAGDYWRVWPAVFHANLTLARARAHSRVFGLAYRSEETDPLWKTAGRQVLIAASPDDPSIGPVAEKHGVAIKPLTHLQAIDLYAGRPLACAP
jgi:hypothetical protein